MGVLQRAKIAAIQMGIDVNGQILVGSIKEKEATSSNFAKAATENNTYHKYVKEGIRIKKILLPENMIVFA
jgi:hypothetical protein